MSFFKRLIPLKARVTILLDRPAVHEGENVQGKVSIESSEYIQSEEVRVEARVYERYTEMVQVKHEDQWVWEKQGRTDTKYSRDTRINGPTDFGSGSQTFPFEVNIPAYRPSHNDGSIQYSLKGVVAVKGRPDVTGEVDLNFLPAMPAMSPTVPIASSIQKVQCAYCRGMFDSSLNQCPNCGAPLIVPPPPAA